MMMESRTRILYGQETRAPFGRDDQGVVIPGKRCHDCQVSIDQFHQGGCDVEECPFCHGQLLMCGGRHEAKLRSLQAGQP